MSLVVVDAAAVLTRSNSANQRKDWRRNRRRLDLGLDYSCTRSETLVVERR